MEDPDAHGRIPGAREVGPERGSEPGAVSRVHHDHERSGGESVDFDARTVLPRSVRFSRGLAAPISFSMQHDERDGNDVGDLPSFHK